MNREVLKYAMEYVWQVGCCLAVKGQEPKTKARYPSRFLRYRNLNAWQYVPRFPTFHRHIACISSYLAWWQSTSGCLPFGWCTASPPFGRGPTHCPRGSSSPAHVPACHTKATSATARCMKPTSAFARDEKATPASACDTQT